MEWLSSPAQGTWQNEAACSKLGICWSPNWSAQGLLRLAFFNPRVLGAHGDRIAPAGQPVATSRAHRRHQLILAIRRHTQNLTKTRTSARGFRRHCCCSAWPQSGAALSAYGVAAGPRQASHTAPHRRPRAMRSPCPARLSTGVAVGSGAVPPPLTLRLPAAAGCCAEARPSAGPGPRPLCGCCGCCWLRGLGHHVAGSHSLPRHHRNPRWQWQRSAPPSRLPLGCRSAWSRCGGWPRIARATRRRLPLLQARSRGPLPRFPCAVRRRRRGDPGAAQQWQRGAPHRSECSRCHHTAAAAQGLVPLLLQPLG